MDYGDGVLPQVKISRVTLEPYCFKTGDELVVAWALCTNGSLLYRHGVTPNKPQGEEWVSVTLTRPWVVSLEFMYFSDF